ncbi:hypothetical protein ERJ75_000970800 [Trypanosoma vivax]|nr:hypothetical protein TRVL_05302 [Trypanosoma vivax]KAH8611392.1 hypothetical protein ERJ75_000970800 [Trypanosoma vivax]
MMAVPDSLRSKAIAQFTTVLKGMQEFADASPRARSFAEELVVAMSAAYDSKESFRDQWMGILANIKSMDGELVKIGPASVATMQPQEMLSREQRLERDRFLRKRVREQIVYDSTCMLCSTCKLVRPDRINLNQLALDSEQNGTQFDYNFDNLCQCTSRSSSEATTSTSSIPRNDGAEER